MSPKQQQSSIEFFRQDTVYMIVYPNLDQRDGKLTNNLIERFVKVSKTHRNIQDQDKVLI